MAVKISEGVATAEAELEIEPTRAQLRLDNARIRTAILAAVGRLHDVDGRPGQDVEAIVAEVRDELAGAIGIRAGD